MNPYSPPTADVALQPQASEIPDEIRKKIKGAWIAGIISGLMTLLATLGGMSGTMAAGFDAWNFLDVALIVGLTFGIYRKSRACAVLMLVYFVGSKIFMTIESGKFSGAILSIAFIYYYAQGVLGTFAYNKLLKE